jgi:uncharacterized metal-binding protein
MLDAGNKGVVLTDISARCAYCPTISCAFGTRDGAPRFCPGINSAQLVDESERALEDAEVLRCAREASRVEAAGYCHWTRVQEIIEFSRRMGFKRIGVAFCIGLIREARSLSDILKAHGFDVVSVCCKVGIAPKETLGLKDSEKIRPGTFEGHCNPIAQALILDGEQCDLNVLVGLCVGHDSLFLKHTSTLTTVLVAKDRVTGHNPAAVLYTSDSYYNRLKNPEEL